MSLLISSGNGCRRVAWSRVLLPLVALLAFAGCEDEGVTDITPPGDVNQAPTAEAELSEGPFFRGVPVVLSAAASVDPDGDPLAFEWTLLEAPEGSVARIEDAQQSSGVLTPDRIGVYSVQLVVDDRSSSDTAVVSVPVEVQQLGDIARDSVLGDTDSPEGEADYVIPSRAQWSGAVTIEPGVRIEFGEGARLIVGLDGRISALGTADQPIRLAGAQDEPGFWQGLEIRSTASNELRHVELTDAGAGDWAGIFVGGRAGIDSSVVRGGAGYGIEISGDGELASFQGNALSENAAGAMRIPPELSAALDSTSTFDAPVEVTGGTIDSELRWPDIGARFFMTGDVRVSAALTIDAGTRMEFDDSVRVEVEPEGSIVAIGTSEAPVRMLGAQDSSGHWYGLTIASTSAANHLRHVELRNAGASGGAGLLLTGTAALDSSTISGSDGYGLRLIGAGRLSGFFDNRFEDHETAPVRLPVAGLHALDDATVYGGAVQVEGGTIADAQTWPATDSALHFLGSPVIEAPVTVQPGAHVQLSQGGRIIVEDEGSLNAVGTETDTIRFTGRQSNRGYWQGIEIRSGSDDNRLEYVLISGAGGGGAGANLYVTGRVALENSLLRESAGYGLLLPTADARIASFANNEFALNAVAPVRIHAAHMGAVDSASSYVGGNGHDFIEVSGGDIVQAQTWPRTDGAFLLTSLVTISAEVSVDPGARIVAAQNQRLVVDTDGAFIAKGTAADSIHIQGQQPVSGYWHGLEVRSQSALNLLDFVRIGHGGGGGYANVYLIGRLTVSNSHIHDSFTYGIDEVGSAAVLDLDAETTFAGNRLGPTSS